MEYCQNNFLSIWARLKRCIVVFSDNETWTRPLGLIEKEKLLVLVTYDESTFNANNSKKRVLKEKRKEIVAFKFLTPIGRLRISNFISNHQLFQDLGWPFNEK